MKSGKKESLYRWLFVLLILSAVGFFNPLNVFTPVTIKFMFYAIGGLAWLVVLKDGLKEPHVYPRRFLYCLMVGITSSVVMAYLFQRQSLKLTLISTFPTILSYACFPLLMRLRIDKQFILKVVGCVVMFCMVVYLANLAAYPGFVFGQEKEEFDLSRGMVRIKIPYIELFVLMFFYCINKWINGYRKPVWRWGMIVLFVFIILSVTRQTIALSMLLGGFLLLKNSSWTKRIIVVTVGMLFYLVVLPNIPIYKSIMELSENQARNNRLGDDDIRIRAWKFYTTEYQTNNLTPVFGNGVPSMGNSYWGRDYERTVNIAEGGNGCLAVDVGWAGFFWNFGAIATIGLFMLFLHAFRKRKSSEERYLTYWILYICATAVASGPILYYNQIFSISTVLYLIYGTKQRIYSTRRSQLQ